MWWQEAQQMRVMDASTYVQSGSLNVTVEPVSGDQAWIRNVTFGGSLPTSNLEKFDSFCGVTYDKTHGRAVWWRPMYQSKAGRYYVDGVPLTEAQITQQNLMFTEVTDDKVARNLWVQETDDIKMPYWEDSYRRPNWCSGGAYNRFTYIEEFDVYMYIHSWDNDVYFLKFPPTA
jgi:hypothetical protein